MMIEIVEMFVNEVEKEWGNFSDWDDLKIWGRTSQILENFKDQNLIGDWDNMDIGEKGLTFDLLEDSHHDPVSGTSLSAKHHILIPRNCLNPGGIRTLIDYYKTKYIMES